MISVNYVNNNKQEPLYLSPLYKVEREINSIMDDVEVAYQEYVNAINMYDLDSTFLEKDNIDPKKASAVEDTEKNFVSKLGASVISIFKKAIAFISDLLNKIKDKFGGNKEKFSKAAAICNQNPKLKNYLTDEVKAAIDRGDMNIIDIKALAELDKQYEELVKLSKKKDIDPNSLKGRWEAAKRKFESVDKAPIVKGILAVAGIITTIGVATDRIKKSKIELNDSMAAMMTWDQENNGKGDIANKGYFRILADAANYTTHQHIVAANQANSISTFLANLMDAIVKKASPKTYENMRKDTIKAAAQNIEQRKTEEYARKKQSRAVDNRVDREMPKFKQDDTKQNQKQNQNNNP